MRLHQKDIEIIASKTDFPIGCICLCSHQRLGIFTHKKKNIFYGVGFDGGKWESKFPYKITNNLYEFIAMQNIRDYKYYENSNSRQ